jgi:hypothetical protein
MIIGDKSPLHSLSLFRAQGGKSPFYTESYLYERPSQHGEKPSIDAAQGNRSCNELAQERTERQDVWTDGTEIRNVQIQPKQAGIGSCGSCIASAEHCQCDPCRCSLCQHARRTDSQLHLASRATACRKIAAGGTALCFVQSGGDGEPMRRLAFLSFSSTH